VNSPEAASAGCPSEWREAKAARERLIGTDGQARAQAAGRAARAVLAHAECEQRRLAGRRVDAGAQATMAAELRRLRRDYLSAATLYQEAAGYGDPAAAVGAWARLAELHLGTARAVEELPTPVDLHGAGERAEFRRDMHEVAASFEIEAALAAARALDAGRRAAGAGEVAGWLRRSCEVLAALDPDSLAEYPACAGAAR
jgi:hypothetical protein